jgi:hypothetical protein
MSILFLLNSDLPELIIFLLAPGELQVLAEPGADLALEAG